MRLIARLPDERQVSALVDSLRNIGFDRGDLIISSLAEEKKFDSVEEATEAGISMIKTERDGLNDTETFAEGIKGLKVQHELQNRFAGGRAVFIRLKNIAGQTKPKKLHINMIIMGICWLRTG